MNSCGDAIPELLPPVVVHPGVEQLEQKEESELHHVHVEVSSGGCEELPLGTARYGEEVVPIECDTVGEVVLGRPELSQPHPVELIVVLDHEAVKIICQNAPPRAF